MLPFIFIDAPNSSSAVVGFVRSFGTYLGDDEKITLNVICPNKIRTGIAAPETFDKVEAAGVELVPVEWLTEAVGKLLGSNDVSGTVFEIAPRIGCFVRDPPDFVNLDSKISGEMTMDLARHIHHPIPIERRNQLGES